VCDGCANRVMSENQTDILRSGTARLAETKPARPDRTGSTLAAIVLAGGLAAPPLADAAGRSVLDLNIASCRTVLGAWEHAFRSIGVSRVGVVEGGAAPSPLRNGARVRTLRDPEPYRGPAGAARDAWESLGRPGRVVIVEGNRWHGGALPTLMESHSRTGADVTVGVCPDGSPAGVYVAEGGAVASIPGVGFVDLKEQWLPKVRDDGRSVRGTVLAGCATVSIRTLTQLLGVARGLGDANSDGGWRLICPGARVIRASDVVDTIVMPGAVVERGAIVARSLVLPGGRVGEGETLIDGIARADGRFVQTGTNSRRVHAATFVKPLGQSESNARGMCDLTGTSRAGIAA